MSTLIGPAHAEEAAYLRVVYDTAPVVRERVEDVLELPQLYQNLVWLEVAQLAPAVLARAVAEVDKLGCLACEHDRHQGEECLSAMTTAEGAESWCLCGVNDRA
jgi:hypothetical protein